MSETLSALAAARKNWIKTLSKGSEQLNRSREFGWHQFVQTGLPKKTEEDFKYTGFSAVQMEGLVPAGTVLNESWIRKSLQSMQLKDAYSIVFANGELISQLSDLQGLKKEGLLIATQGRILDSAISEFKKLRLRARHGKSHALDALNAGLLQGACAIKLSADRKLHKPLQLIFLSDGKSGSSHTKVYLKLQNGSQLELLQTHLSEGDQLCTSSIEIAMLKSSVLSHLKIVAENPNSQHALRSRVYLASESQYQQLHLNLGSKLTRDSHDVFHMGKLSKSQTMGSAALGGTEHLDNHYSVFHNVGECESDQLFKAATSGSARSVFTGRIHISKNSQKAQAGQLSNSMLLSEQSESDSRPQLEIYADDVKANHGATVGAIRDEELFYLQSRAIPAEVARTMLTEAFVLEPIEKIQSHRLRHHALHLVKQKIKSLVKK